MKTLKRAVVQASFSGSGFISASVFPAIESLMSLTVLDFTSHSRTYVYQS